MASLVFDSCFDDMVNGRLNFGADTFRCMLCTSGYSPKPGHEKRSDVTNEVAARGGYQKGGFKADVSSARNAKMRRHDITLGGISVPDATITARYAVYYKARGGEPEFDNLVAVIDFGADISSTDGDWSLTASTLRLQN